MTPLKRKEKRHLQIRQEVISVAEKLLKEEGIEALTIRRLAELLDYSPASLYEYFCSKEQILVALRHNIFKKQLEKIRRIDADLPPISYFQTVCLEMLRFRLMPENYRIMFVELSKESLKQIVSKDLVELRELIDLALQRLNLPQFATVPQRQLAIFILRSYLEGVTHLAFRGELPEELSCPEENTKKVFSLLFNDIP